MNDLLQQAVTRGRLEQFEEEILSRLPPVQIGLREFYAEGLYAREITIPAGTLITGKIHKYTNFNILTRGEMSVLTETGFVHVKAPFSVVSPPGTKRLAYTHTECVWTTMHGTHETDRDKIEAYFTADSDVEYLAFAAEKESLVMLEKE